MTRPISHRRASTSIAVICALALVPLAPLRAADEKSDEPSKSEKLVTQMGALSTAIEGLREKGADTVKEHGGGLEGALLSSFAIKAAAARIREENTGTGYLVASWPEELQATFSHSPEQKGGSFWMRRKVKTEQ